MRSLGNKTQNAFWFSADRLFKQSKEVFFWTLTFIHVPISDDSAMEDWATFCRRLQHHFPAMRGLRVTELHRSHGIHFHFFINERIPLRRMKQLCKGSGKLNGRNRYLDFGRMSVAKCDAKTIDYLADYLTPEYRKKHEFGQRRRWGAMGGFRPTRCRDVEYRSQSTRNRELLFGGAQCGYGAIVMITHYTNLWGHVRKWPDKCRALVYKQKLPNGSEWIRKLNVPF